MDFKTLIWCCVNFNYKKSIIFYVDEPEYKLEYRSRVWSPTENYFSRYSGYIPIQVHFDIGRIHSDTGNNSRIHSYAFFMKWGSGDTKMLTEFDNIIFSFLFSKSLAEHISKIVKKKTLKKILKCL